MGFNISKQYDMIATDGSFGDYMLLKRKLLFQEIESEITIDSPHIRQAVFNMRFLRAMEQIHGVLHCVYSFIAT